MENPYDGSVTSDQVHVYGKEEVDISVDGTKTPLLLGHGELSQEPREQLPRTSVAAPVE